MSSQEPIGLLREALDTYLEAPSIYTEVRKTCETEKAAERVVERFQDLDPKPPEAFELEPIWQRIAQAWRSGDLSSLARRDVRYAPFIFFYPPTDRQKWLGADPSFVERFFKTAPGADRPRVIVALLQEFLHAAEPELPSYVTLRTLLRARIVNGPAELRLRRWRDICEKHGLLERNNHLRLIASWQALGRPSVDGFLSETGLPQKIAQSALMRRAVKTILADLQRELRGEPVDDSKLNDGLGWLRMNDHLRFEDLNRETAEALLSPLVSRSPQDETAKLLRRFFLACFGDPRTVRIKGWAGVRDELRKVFLRMLVGPTLEAFFKILDSTADPQWEYRKQFWSAYHQARVIEEAWLALGRSAWGLAGPKLRGECGRLVGAERQQSVLLLRLRGLTIAEWSHNGSCRLWVSRRADKPTLGKSQYEAVDLRGGQEPDARYPHVWPEKGSWQSSVASWIFENTGIRLRESDYMPRGRSKGSGFYG